MTLSWDIPQTSVLMGMLEDTGDRKPTRSCLSKMGNTWAHLDGKTSRITRKWKKTKVRTLLSGNAFALTHYPPQPLLPCVSVPKGFPLFYSLCVPHVTQELSSRLSTVQHFHPKNINALPTSHITKVWGRIPIWSHQAPFPEHLSTAWKMGISH